MKDDFKQLEKGYILMLRLKDEEISRLKGMISEPVKHGEWMIGERCMMCSKCGWIYEYYGGLEEEWNFCPHCGLQNG